MQFPDNSALFFFQRNNFFSAIEYFSPYCAVDRHINSNAGDMVICSIIRSDVKFQDSPPFLLPANDFRIFRKL